MEMIILLAKRLQAMMMLYAFRPIYILTRSNKRISADKQSICAYNERINPHILPTVSKLSLVLKNIEIHGFEIHKIENPLFSSFRTNVNYNAINTIDATFAAQHNLSKLGYRGVYGIDYFAGKAGTSDDDVVRIKVNLYFD